MKAATAKLLRAVIRLVEDDVRELADTVVEIDEREASNAASAADVRERTAAMEKQIQTLFTRLDILRDASDSVDHSWRVRP